MEFIKDKEIIRKREFANEAKERIRQMYFSTKDIAIYNLARLEARQIEQYDFSIQKEIVEQELREYIGYKLDELCHPITEQELSERPLTSLIESLSALKSTDKKIIIDSFTKYTIKVIYKLQGITVNWKLGEVKECNFISINDYECLLLTPKEYNSIEVFNRIWNYFESQTLEDNMKRA